MSLQKSKSTAGAPATSDQNTSTIVITRQDAQDPKKNTRGPTMCMPIWAMQAGERIQVTINDLGQSTGEGATKLATFLGTIARTTVYAPLRYEDWRLMPKDYKITMWKMVQEKFDVDMFLQDWVLASLNKNRGSFKSFVKSEWVNKKKKDKRVCDEDRQWLLEFWSTGKAEKRSAVGKQNRMNMISPHTLGRKSYARFKEEVKAKKPDKSEPTRAELYILSHVRPDGKPLNDKVVEIIDKVKEKMQTESSTPHDCSGPSDILSQVLEDKPYYSIAYGLGPKWGVRDSRYSIMKKALKAKNNAEDRAQRVEDKFNKVLALLQKNNPNMNLNDNIDSPNDENDNLIVEENSDELGSSPILPMLQSSTVVPETPALDDVSMVDVYLPMLRNNSSKGGSSGVEANDVHTFFDYMISSYQKKDTPAQAKKINGSNIGDDDSYSCAEGMSCVILHSLHDPDVEVARGGIVSKNPHCRVGDQELGKGFCEIFVEVAIMPDEPLVRPYASFQTIRDAVAESIAWPSRFAS